MITKPESLRLIVCKYHETQKTFAAGHVLLTYLANNGRLLAAAKELGINHQRLRRILVDFYCIVHKKRPQNQGALVQPERVHQLAKEYAAYYGDRNHVVDLVKRYREAMQIGQAAQSSSQPSVSVAAVKRPQRLRKAKPWWSFIDGAKGVFDAVSS